MTRKPEKTEVTLDMLPWDTEERHALLNRHAHLRDTTVYLTTALLSWMQAEWGGVISHLKTWTDVETGEVGIYKCKESDAGAVPLRRVGAQNAGEFSFWRPLKKLEMKVPPDRQFIIKPFIRKYGKEKVFIFPMAKVVSVPRGRREEADEQEETESES